MVGCKRGSGNYVSERTTAALSENQRFKKENIKIPCGRKIQTKVSGRK